MFSPDQIKGLALPKKILCLTFDDGPGETPGSRKGPNTLKLAEYLFDQKVSATFFMVGGFIAQYPHIMPAVSKMGHIVGNHTYTHPNMKDHFIEGKNVEEEIRKTDELISDWVPGNTIFFRAPFGQWLPEISNMLNLNLAIQRQYMGPFHWDIQCDDWALWRDNKSASTCADLYLAEVRKVNRGIVLMHDSSADIPESRVNNRTLETIKKLIPRLKRRGYKFIRLDEFPHYVN